MSIVKDFVVDLAHSVWTRRICSSYSPGDDPCDPTFLESLPVLYTDISAVVAAEPRPSAVGAGTDGKVSTNGVRCARAMPAKNLPVKPPGHLRFVCASDTHGMHRALPVPLGDVFLHAGDILVASRHLSRDMCIAKYADFNAWLGSLPHAHKFVIGGNHDWCLDETQPGGLSVDEVRALLSNATFLLNEDAYIPLPLTPVPVAAVASPSTLSAQPADVTTAPPPAAATTDSQQRPQEPPRRRLRLFGSPFSFGSSGNRAFQGRGPKPRVLSSEGRKAEAQLAALAEGALLAQLRTSDPLKQQPQPIDILMTHHSVHANQLPSWDLSQSILGSDPVARVHIGGHYHEYYGVRAHAIERRRPPRSQQQQQSATTPHPPVVAVCASVLNGRYKLTRGAVVFDMC